MKNLLKFQGRIGLNAAYVLIACAAFLFVAFAPLVVEADNPPLFTKQYDRTIGKPNLYADKFKSCNTGATYKLVVENGDATGKKRISSASITLNGNEVVKESDFNQKTGRIEKNVSLAEANTLDVKLASGTGGFIKTSIFCTANCLEVKITEPKSGDSRGSRPLIKGELYNTEGMVGVTVDNGVGNSSHAYKSGNVFGVVSIFDSSADGKSIATEGVFTATATDVCGYKASDSVTIKYYDVPTHGVELEVNPKAGVIDKNSGSLKVTLGEQYAKSMDSNFEWDFDGDGVVDMSGAGLDGLTHEYTLPGIYFVRSKETVSNSGNVFVGTGVVVVYSKDEIDAEIKPVWNGLKNALMKGDIEEALKFISPMSEDKYRAAYEAIKDKLPKIGAGMGDIEFVDLHDNHAEYRTSKKRLVNGREKKVWFPMDFYMDNNGLWKIYAY